jgi:hypothetical protein
MPGTIASNADKVESMTASLRTGNEYRIPQTMRTWVLGGPQELALR